MQKIRNEIRQELQQEMDLKINKTNLKMKAMDLKLKQLLDVIGQKNNTIQKNGFVRSPSRGSIAMNEAKDNAEAHYVSTR